MAEHEEHKVAQEEESVMDKISEKLHFNNNHHHSSGSVSSSSSDSDDDKKKSLKSPPTSGTSSFGSKVRRLFGRERPVHKVFGGGKQSAASLSSELENAQQMFEDLAASITNHIYERSNLQLSPVDHVGADEGNSLRRDAAIIQSHQTLDTIAETSSSTSVPSSSQSNKVSDAALQWENLTTDGGNVPVTRYSLSSRRRIAFPRLSNVDFGLPHELRRRLN